MLNRKTLEYFKEQEDRARSRIDTFADRVKEDPFNQLKKADSLFADAARFQVFQNLHRLAVRQDCTLDMLLDIIDDETRTAVRNSATISRSTSPSHDTANAALAETWLRNADDIKKACSRYQAKHGRVP